METVSKMSELLECVFDRKIISLGVFNAINSVHLTFELDSSSRTELILAREKKRATSSETITR